MSVHHAPSVVYPVRHSVLPTILALGAWFAGLGLLLFGCDGLQGADWRPWVLASFLVASAAWGICSTRQQATGTLHWDGAAWRWEPDRSLAQFEVASLLVVADLQRMLVVKLTLQQGRHVWFNVHRAHSPERWLDVRRAIHLPGRTAPLLSSPGSVSARAVAPVAALELVVEPTEARTRFNQ